MYVAMDYLLNAAEEEGYGVLAVNCINMEMVRAAIQAAEEEESGIIINIGPGQMKNHATPEIMVPMIKRLADASPMPIALNLDHGHDLDFIIRCINLGFTNIMIDASSDDFEENIRKTRIVTRLAHAKGISVEAELGHVGQAADGDNDKDSLYTNPAQALEFVERTGVDALAVAIGTAHGAYPKGMVPKMDFERLQELNDIVPIPLVLHGGSGSGDANIKEAVKHGIRKMNVCTDAFEAGKQAMLDALEKDPNLDYMAIVKVMEAGIKENIRGYIRVLGSKGRYTYDASKVKEYE